MPKYEVSISYSSKVMAKVKVFRYVGQRPRSRSPGQTFWYQWKGLITKNAHVKYKSSTSIGSKVMAKVFRNVDQRSPSRLQGHWPCLSVIWKGFISWVCMLNMKSLSLTVQKLSLKYFFHRQTDRQDNNTKFHSGGIKIILYIFTDPQKILLIISHGLYIHTDC